MNTIKFRGKYIDGQKDRHGEWIYGTPGYNDGNTYINQDGRLYSALRVDPKTICQFVGILDNKHTEEFPAGEELYHHDICEFDNGDKFVIKCEDHLEYYVEWIGEPECEDQARDFYRVSTSIKIGNVFDNPELLEE